MTLAPLDTETLATKARWKMSDDFIDTLEADFSDLLDRARSNYADGEIGSPYREDNPLEPIANVAYEDIEAVCEVTGLTYNKHLGSSPWLDENGVQAY